MATIKLNHQLVRALMTKAFMRPIDLAARMKKSKQMTNYIIHRGGMQYAKDLAKIFKCDRLDLLTRPEIRMRLPKGKRMKGSMVSKAGKQS